MKDLAPSASARMKGERKSTDRNAGTSSTRNACQTGCNKMQVARCAGIPICEGIDLYMGISSENMDLISICWKF